MISRRIDRAREAYKKRDINATIAAHQLHEKEEHKEQGEYLKSAVYGGLDGIITSFAVVAGVTGGLLSAGVVIILGFANLIADGISMAIGDYLSSKAQTDFYYAEREREQWEVEHYPQGEKLELTEIYRSQGMEDPDAKEVVELISKNEKTWVDIMMVEELGLVRSGASPVMNGIVTFVSFIVFGLIPLSVYVLKLTAPGIMPNPLMFAVGLTILTLFGLGFIKAKFTGRNSWISGMEVLVIGGVAAGVAYFIGHILSALVR